MIKLREMISRTLFFENKKLRVFDFDETLVKTNSYIYVTHTNGKTNKLTPGQYAVYKEKPGDTFNYDDFQQVKNPSEIKQITKVIKQIENKSSGDLFILTARAASLPIKNYLNDIGIKRAEVIALASNNPQDKADWIENKIDNEGYTDIYFADDSPKNVEATKRMLRTKDGIRWRVQHIKY
jgi:phosphoglycolate phosphatase-like HAD superfamily hydrolase